MDFFRFSLKLIEKNILMTAFWNFITFYYSKKSSNELFHHFHQSSLEKIFFFGIFFNLIDFHLNKK
jgi:hypothetical protein